MHVTEVKKAGPADKASIKPGDIIVSVGGVKLKNDNDLVRLIGLKKPKEKTEVVVYRLGKNKFTRRSVTVTVGTWPSSQYAKNVVADNSYGLLVDLVDNLDQEFIDNHGIKGKSGLVIIQVKEQSISHRAGLKVGEIITRVDFFKTEPLKSQKTFNSYLNEAWENKKSIMLTIEGKDDKGVSYLVNKELKIKG